MKGKLLVSILILSIIIFSITTNFSLAFRPYSKGDKYPLNIKLSMQHKTEIYGLPFGEFLVDQNGTMENENKQKGEYKYLGYNYNNQPITNDRYFRSIERRGNVFDQNYSNVVWQDIPEAPKSWHRTGGNWSNRCNTNKSATDD